MAARAVGGSSITPRAFLIAGCMACSACEPTAVVETGVSEQAAARSAAILHAHHVGVQREPHVGSARDSATFDVRVLSGDVATACRLLYAQPPETEDVTARAKRTTFLPTPAEEQADRLAQIATELERSIRLWDGVTNVRVQLVGTPPPPVLGGAQPKLRAAVTVAHLPGRTPNVRAIQELVSHVIGDGDKTQALVSLVETRPITARPMAQLGPIAVTATSAPLLKTVLAALFTLTTVLAALLLWTVWKARRVGR